MKALEEKLKRNEAFLVCAERTENCAKDGRREDRTSNERPQNAMQHISGQQFTLAIATNPTQTQSDLFR